MHDVNIGVANNRLKYQPGEPGIPGTVTLNYTDGDFCHHSKKRYSTLLRFECGMQQESIKLLAITDDCIVIIEFITKHVCLVSLIIICTYPFNVPSIFLLFQK